jgi:hypothetical protein
MVYYRKYMGTTPWSTYAINIYSSNRSLVHMIIKSLVPWSNRTWDAEKVYISLFQLECNYQ